jgi:tRNA-uridine 2-sulfurtransferase
MSGGVDSSVAAARLLDQGHDITGVTLKLWGGPSDSGCCSVADVEDARRVAAQIGIPHYVFNLTESFEEHVVRPYVDAYAHARTPNPCVECNRSIKFGALFERMTALGFDSLATGHHARVVHDDASKCLRVARGRDRAKDQSYVLYMLERRQLERTLLPVGELTKAEVRTEAERRGLRTAAKAESMDVCFITRGGRAEFLAERVERRPGAIVGVGGDHLGEHDDAARFTIGQRRGTGVAAGERRFVVDIDAATATITLGRREDLLRDTVDLDDLVLDPAIDVRGVDVLAQTRAHGEPVPARVHRVNPYRDDPRRATVTFATPQPRVAPGQVVALYDGDLLLGGGIATLRDRDAMGTGRAQHGGGSER